MSAELFLVVGGRSYGGWKSIRVTRSIESLAGSFALEVSDRWGNRSEPWPIAEEDECRVEILVGPRQRHIVIDGFVSVRDLDASKDSRKLEYEGRDRAAELVECSVVLSNWTFRNVTLAEFASTIAAPFGVTVSVQAGLTLGTLAKIVVQPGDKAFEAIAREAASAGVLAVSDGAGGIVLTRAGSARAEPLVEGFNIEGAGVRYDATDRFRRYVLVTQVPGTDDASGAATQVRAEATDEGVRRAHRVALIRPDTGMGTADARRRADWEARIRAARAETVRITVQGWTQPDGTLWPLNAITRVKAPRLIGVNADMLISQVEHSISEGGQVTQLQLVRPDAFTPEPQAKVKAPSGGTGDRRWSSL